MKWNGPAAKGAMRDIRLMKQQDAIARNAITPPDMRRKAARKAGYSRHSDWPLNNA